MGNQNSVNNDIFLKDSEVQEKLIGEKPNTMLIKTYTWSRDSHGLYDYEGAHQIQMAENKIYKSGIIFKQDNNNIVAEEARNTNLGQPLVNLQMEKNNRYTLSQSFLQPENVSSNNNMYCTKEELSENSMWLIVRSLKKIKGQTHGWALKENDYLKLGRVKFRVKEICIYGQNNIDTEHDLATNNNANTNNNNNTNSNNKQIKKTETQGTVPQEDLANSDNGEEIHGDGKTCRFCLSEVYTRDDPLINPCKCQGSVKYVHIKCLQQWLQNKITTKSSVYCTAYSWVNLSCELCHHQYPHIFNEAGQNFSAFEITKPSGPYLILEVIGKDINESKGIHVINMEQKNAIKIGRGSESDMKITDISVSRCHAFIKLKNGKFYLEDHNSKFGTLALIKGEMDLSYKTNNIAIQVNRTVFTFFMRKQSRFQFQCCGSKGKKPQQKSNMMMNNSLNTNQNLNTNNQNVNTQYSNMPVMQSNNTLNNIMGSNPILNNNVIVENNVNNQNIHRNMLQHQQQQQLRIERNIRSSFHSMYSQQQQNNNIQQIQHLSQMQQDIEGQLPIEEEKQYDDRIIQTQHNNEIKPNNLEISNNQIKNNSRIQYSNNQQQFQDFDLNNNSIINNNNNNNYNKEDESIRNSIRVSQIRQQTKNTGDEYLSISVNNNLSK